MLNKYDVSITIRSEIGPVKYVPYGGGLELQNIVMTHDIFPDASKVALVVKNEQVTIEQERSTTLTLEEPHEQAGIRETLGQFVRRFPIPPHVYALRIDLVRREE